MVDGETFHPLNEEKIQIHIQKQSNSVFITNSKSLMKIRVFERGKINDLFLFLAVTDPKVLIEGVLFRARYLGSTQLVSGFDNSIWNLF